MIREKTGEILPINVFILNRNYKEAGMSKYEMYTIREKALFLSCSLSNNQI